MAVVVTGAATAGICEVIMTGSRGSVTYTGGVFVDNIIQSSIEQ